MSYISKQDLYDFYGADDIDRLADRDQQNDPDKMLGTISQAIEGAQSEVSGYLAKVYDMPIAAAPSLVKNITCQVAIYFLAGPNKSEEIEAGYKNATRLLEKIAKGDIVLDIPKNPEEHDNPVISSPGRIFDRNSLGSF